MKYFGWVLFLLLVFSTNYNISNAEGALNIRNGSTLNTPKTVNELNLNNDLREIIQDMKNQLLSAQTEIIKLQESNFNLKQALSEKDKTISDKDKAISDKDKVITVMKDQKSLLEKAVYDNQQQLQKMSLDSRKETDISILKDNRISQLESQNQAYKLKVEDLSLMLTNAKNELEMVNKKIAVMKQQETLSASTSSDLQSNLVLWRSKAEDLQKKLETAQTLNVSMERQKVVDKAIEYLREEKGASSLFYFNLAKAYQESKNFQQAIENYKIALNINPDFGKAYCQLGIAYAEARDYQNSLNSFKNYLKYTRNSEETDLVKGFITKLEKNI